MHLIGPHDLDDQFQDQISHEARIPLVLPMIVCYSSPSFLGDPDFPFKNRQNFSCTFAKTFAILLFVPHVPAS